MCTLRALARTTVEDHGCTGKVGTLHEHLPSVLLDPCLYYCCTTHQALAALRSLCTEGCARTVRSTCVGVCNVIREFIWTAATLLCAQIWTGFFDAYCTYTCTCMYNISLNRGLPRIKAGLFRRQGLKCMIYQ